MAEASTSVSQLSGLASPPDGLTSHIPTGNCGTLSHLQEKVELRFSISMKKMNYNKSVEIKIIADMSIKMQIVQEKTERVFILFEQCVNVTSADCYC